MVASTFEFVGELRRSEKLFSVASQVLDEAQSDNPIATTGSIVVCTKLTRIQLNRGRIAEAAQSLKSAIAKSVQSFTMKASLLTWTLWETIEPGVHWSTDKQVSEFFTKVTGYFPTEFAVKAWLRYLESGILFNRSAIQEANRRLLDAEQFAGSGSDVFLLARIRTEKLFVRAESIFTNQMQWRSEALHYALYLTGKDELQEVRRTFGHNVQTFALTYSGTMFGQILQVLEEFREHFPEHPFEVAVYALWKVGSRSYLLSTALPDLETYLRSKAPFLPV
jgi:hypothetical protein